MKHLNQCRYDSALYYAEETTALFRGIIGENSLQYANMLHSLAISHFYLGSFLKAKYYALKEVEHREAFKATDDANYVSSLENASIICRSSGNLEEALVLIKKAEKIALKIYGPEKPEYANILSSYAGVYNDMGCSENDIIFLKQAKIYFLQAENIYKKNGGKSQGANIVNISNQASYNNSAGNSPLAESLFLEVVSLCETEYGHSNPFYASALNNLAVFYYNKGNYMQAEKLFITAVDIYKKSPAANSIQSGICINNLGALYNDIGNYHIASKLITESRKIIENNYLNQHPAFAIVLNNLASVYLLKEYYASSENKNNEDLLNSGKMFLKADSIFEANCQMPHPDVYIIMNNIALWYKLTGDTTKSLQIKMDQAKQNCISLNAISMINKMKLSSLLPTNENEDAHSILEPIIITIKIKLVNQMIDERALERNREDQFLPTKILVKFILGKANNIKKVLGPYHPAYAEVLKMLAALYESIGDYRTEEELTLNYINIISNNTFQDFTFLSESEKEMYYQTRLPDMHSFIAYTLKRKVKNPKITCSAYNLILQNKGLMLKSSTAMRLSILNSNDSVLLKKYDEWLSIQKEISVLYSTPVEMRTKDLNILENKANTMEKSLVKSSQIFGDYRKDLQITWKNVRDSLKPDEAAIEFTHFRIREKDGGDAVIYCALIVRLNSKYPKMIQLFEEKQLFDLMNKPTSGSYSFIKNLYGTPTKTNDSLYKLIWQPLEKYLEGIKTIYYSPDGILHKISLAALGKGKNIFLCDNYNINTLSTTGKVYMPKNSEITSNITVNIFGGINYNTDSSETEIWNYLEGTLIETQIINFFFKEKKIKTNYFTKSDASEENFKKTSSGCNILHLATHGFFYPSIEEEKKDTTVSCYESRIENSDFGLNQFVKNTNPLMRSGLVLAGANNVWQKQYKNDKEDGVLTALEVTSIDLRKTQIVVLSACETGLGDIKGSEGVYGLQRAFKMAGVKFIIMSLWQIPDKETVEFMKIFYTKLLKNNDIKLAFLETQKEMRKKYDPYYWAAFVLIE